MGGAQAGWGEVDDDESVRAMHAAIDGGITFFDTAATYGAGHSERVLGRAVRGHRDRVVLATKFGYAVNDSAHTVDGTELDPNAIRVACDKSLRRLDTDRIELFQLHVGDLDPGAADDVIATLEELVTDGRIRAHGVSTDNPDLARAFLTAPGCAAVQHQLNVLEDHPELVELCEAAGRTSIARGPLAMGLLAGRYDGTTRFAATDLRAHGAPWMAYFVNGRPNADWLRRRDAIREILTSAERTPAQGAIAWLWARSPAIVPIPGVRTVAQARENAGALAHGPLTARQMQEIDHLLQE